MADSFPPPHPKLPLPLNPNSIEDLAAYLTRVVARLNDWQDIDVTFTGPGVSFACIHALARVPSYYEVVWADAEVTVFADTASGWGYNVVYFQSNAAARVRIRLR